MDNQSIVDDLPILLVDDEPHILRSVERTLRDKSWELVTTLDPEEALALVEGREFAVVISDFRMTPMDGVAFLTQVRERWPNTERILLTAHADADALERGINEAGISRFLRKPWKTPQLVEMLQQAMSLSQMRREHTILHERLRNRNEELLYLNRLLQDSVAESAREIVSFRHRWDIALNAISDPLIIVSAELRLEGANDAAAKIAGKEFSALEGEQCFKVLFGRRQPCLECPLWGEHTAPLEKGGRFFDARAYPLPESGGAHLCVYRDVTRELAFREEAAHVEKMAAIGRLAGGVAHEMNNPLHGILSFVQLAQKPELPVEKLGRYHSVIRDCALRCRDIVQSLRDFSRRDDSGEARKRIDLEAVCDKALILFENKDRPTLTKVAPPRPVTCVGNANQLSQVVVNLLQNAIDASPRGGEVVVTIAADQSEAVVIVEDQGPGISDEAQQKIFEPFYTTKPEGLGTGLGLAISHTIMGEHGGALRVGAASIGGARFEMRLPLAEEDADE